MRKQGNVLLRGLGVSVIALGLMGTGDMSVSAQNVVCNPNPLLGGADGDGDGTVTIAEIRELAANPQVSDESEANLLAVADRAEANGVTGIQFRGCTPEADDGAGETPTDPTAPGETPTATTAPGGDTGVDQDAGDGTEQDVDDDGVDQDTGDGNGTGDGDGNGAGDGDDNGAGDGDDNGAGDGVDQDTGDGADDGVTDLPETGVGQASDSNTSSMIMLGAGSLLAAAGAFTFRMKRA